MINNRVNELLIPLKKERLNEKVASQIKDLIFSNEIGMGQKLPPERDLAARLGVSRVIVREALRSLEQSGLIDIRPGMAGGAFVVHNLHMPLFNVARDLVASGKLSLAHFVGARRAVECFSVRLATQNATPADIERLHCINEKFIVHLTDNKRFRQEHASFHILMAKLSRNPLIMLMVESVFELLNSLRPDTFQSAKFIRNTYERHEAILTAMKQKNVPLCEELMAVDAEHTKRLKNFRSRLQ
jgi:GntR family transcriptional regulator, transcriptional repressor for pyruvate dehydrogenase complex